MGVFDDKRYQELDWISQATTPIENKLNDYLALLPDEIDITYNTFIQYMSSYDVNLNLESIVIGELCKHASYQSENMHSGRNDFMKNFEFQTDGPVEIDFDNRVINGRLFVKKINSVMDEKVLEALLGKEGATAIGYIEPSKFSITRANEIAELIGSADDVLKKRSQRQKRQLLYQRVLKLFQNNEWQIMNADLANKLGYWIVDYITTGNLAAMSNFCRLKVMTHKGMPIYSMEEVK